MHFDDRRLDGRPVLGCLCCMPGCFWYIARGRAQRGVSTGNTVFGRFIEKRLLSRIRHTFPCCYYPCPIQTPSTIVLHLAQYQQHLHQLGHHPRQSIWIQGVGYTSLSSSIAGLHSSVRKSPCNNLTGEPDESYYIFAHNRCNSRRGVNKKV